jgi:hypothetical protein
MIMAILLSTTKVEKGKTILEVLILLLIFGIYFGVLKILGGNP